MSETRKLAAILVADVGRPVDGGDRRGLCALHLRGCGAAAVFRRYLEQRLVCARGVRGDQLHLELGLCRIRRGGLLDRRIPVDHRARARLAAEEVSAWALFASFDRRRRAT